MALPPRRLAQFSGGSDFVAQVQPHSPPSWQRAFAAFLAAFFADFFFGSTLLYRLCWHLGRYRFFDGTLFV